MRKREPASDENLTPLFRWLFLLGLAAYIVPVLLVTGIVFGAGIGVGYWIWGH